MGNFEINSAESLYRVPISVPVNVDGRRNSSTLTMQTLATPINPLFNASGGGAKKLRLVKKASATISTNPPSNHGFGVIGTGSAQMNITTNLHQHNQAAS